LCHFVENLSLHPLEEGRRNKHDRLFRHRHEPLAGSFLANRVAGLGFDPSGTHQNFIPSQPQRRPLGHNAENLAVMALFEDFEKCCASGVAKRGPTRYRVEDHSSTNGNHRRKLPHDEAFARKHERFMLQAQLREGALPWSKSGLPVEQDFRNGFRRSSVKMHARAMLQLRSRRQKLKSCIDAPSRPPFARRGQGHAALHGGMFNARQIDRGALSCARALDGLSARLKTADAQPLASRKKLYFLSHSYSPGNQGAGDHRSETFHRERAIDGQTEVARGVFARYLSGDSYERFAQFVDSGAGFRADRDNRRCLKKGALQVVFRLRSEEHTSELQSLTNLVCRLLLEKKKPSTPCCNATTSSNRLIL